MIDASVVVAATLDTGMEGRWAEEILSRAGNLAPQLLEVEAANILRGFERAGRLESTSATLAMRDVVELDVVRFPFEPFAARIWALRHNLSSYDAWYVAVAEATGSSLATLDRRLARAPGPSCRFLLPPGPD